MNAAIEWFDGGCRVFLDAQLQPVAPDKAEFVRELTDAGGSKLIALRDAKVKFHLPGQHDQQDHAGGRGGASRDRSKETSGTWRHETIDIDKLSNTTHTPEKVHELESAFYNAEPETVDEMFGWSYLEDLQERQRAFEEEWPGLMGVRCDIHTTGKAATVRTMEDAIDHEKLGGVESPAAASWINHHGEEMHVPRSPPAIPLGRFKRCYDNALEFVERNPGYRYCEGLVTDPSVKMVFQHGWTINEKNEVVDPTLGWQPKAYYHGVVFKDAKQVRAARRASNDLMTISMRSFRWLKQQRIGV